ncbi:MAG TPA: shikimate kinase [Dehalococcoidia bacterium]|jgi:shikimate kinase
MKDQIWLVGFMGTGKSRLSRPLATALDWDVLDVDHMIELEAGDDIAGIFRSGGEAAFRVLESQAVERAAQRSNVVIATGGGTVLADANRAAMRERGFIVCLDARPETIAARLMHSESHISERPLLAGSDPLAKIIALKSERQSLYAQADFIIQTDDLTPDQVTHQVLTAYREQSTPVAGGSA